jgi:hypothetical protein
MPTPEYKDLIIKQVADGLPVLVCNGLHYAVGGLDEAEWKVIKPEYDGDPWTTSVQIGDWKLTAEFYKSVDGNETTYSDVTYTESWEN